MSLNDPCCPPVTLEGDVVRLEPLEHNHIPLLWAAAKDNIAEIFRWIPYAMQTARSFEESIEKILLEQATGTDSPVRDSGAELRSRSTSAFWRRNGLR